MCGNCREIYSLAFTRLLGKTSWTKDLQVMIIVLFSNLSGVGYGRARRRDGKGTRANNEILPFSSYKCLFTRGASFIISLKLQNSYNECCRTDSTDAISSKGAKSMKRGSGCGRSRRDYHLIICFRNFLILMKISRWKRSVDYVDISRFLQFHSLKLFFLPSPFGFINNKQERRN